MEGILLFAYAIVFGLSCTFIAVEKGRSLLIFFIIGAFFGPVGLLITALARNNEKQLNGIDLKAGVVKKCPFCAEMIKPEAIKCKHCGSELVKGKPAGIVATKPNASDKDKVDAKCSCGHSFSYQADHAGRRVSCPGCRSPLVLQ